MAVKFDGNFALGKQREKQQTREHWRMEFSYSSEPLYGIYLSAAKTASRRAADGEAPDPLLPLAAHANPPPLQQACTCCYCATLIPTARVSMALPAWRQALQLSLRASEGDVSGCSLPPPAPRNLHSATA